MTVLFAAFNKSMPLIHFALTDKALSFLLYACRTIAKLSDHIDTDSRPGKRKAPPPAEDGENNTSKRVRSASVEPPPPNFPTTDLPPRPPTPPPPPKPPLHFRKKTTMDTGTDNLGNSTAGMRAEGGVIQMTNGQQYTAPPANIGFVRPQCVESPWRNTTDRNRADWGAQDGPKGWIRLYRAKYVPNARDSILKLLFVIPRLVDAPKVVISPPTAREELDERLPAPWNFLISSIPEASLKTLTDQCVWSTPTITFLVFTFDMPIPRYIMTLQNFTCVDTLGTHYRLLAL
ncbi:hypothetical protein C8R43DRAFT_1200390 [Mycena crocata]|nr:hypothetical protein C8R43DRAFT_1200390 [Mycena crocata]